MSPAIGCTTTAVNFVVTDGEAKDVSADVPDGTAVPADGLDAGVDVAGLDAAAPGDAADDSAIAVSVDATTADVAGGDTSSRPTDVDAQIEDSGYPAFAVGAPVAGPSRYVEYKCCTSLTGPCYVGYQGDDTTCRDEATWTDYANAACADQGRVMVGLGMYVGC